MNRLEIKALPYDEEEILYLLISASSFAFSGFVEVYTKPEALEEFGINLTTFPNRIDHIVTFKYGDGSDEWAYHLLLQAQAIDSVGHSALHVRMQSFVGMPGNALADFYIPSEPAAINELGRAIINWVKSPSESLVWQPRA